MQIYIVRHGETLWNVQKRLQGRTDIELNDNGRFLAKKTAEALKSVPFTVCFSSPLQRAKETAGILLADRHVPVREDERLIEISFGEMEGLVNDGSGCGMLKNYQDFFKAPGRYVPPPGGEALSSLCRRTEQFLTDITGRAELEQETVLVATHGAAMRALLNSLREYSPNDFWGKGVPKNCAVAVLESHGGEVRICKEDEAAASL